MRVISRRARPPVSSSGAFSPYSSTSVAARAVEIICGKWLIQAQSWSCASASMLATPAPIFSTHSRNSPLSAFEYFLSRSRRHEPHRALKQIRIGDFDSRLFFAGHGMSGEIAPADVFAENGCRAGQHFDFGASDIGQQSLRAQEQGPRRPISSMIAPTGAASRTTWLPRTASTGSVWPSSIAPLSRARSSTGARSQPTIRPAKRSLLQRQPEGAADEAGADDGDLANCH